MPLFGKNILWGICGIGHIVKFLISLYYGWFEVYV
jgi:hypothetical protein